MQGEFSQPSADRSQDEEENFPVQTAAFGGREDCEEPDSGSAENKLNRWKPAAWVHEDMLATSLLRVSVLLGFFECL